MLPSTIMRRILFLLLLGIAVGAVCRPATAQKFLPKTIQFQGDGEYSTEELLAAAGLKTGVSLDYSEMGQHTQKLLASGAFASVAFKFDGRDLVFSLTPSSDLYAIRLDNLPLTPGADLDARLHALLPLYHGKVPSDGGLQEDVRIALQNLLAEQGMTATVMATNAAALGTHKMSTVVYSISAPAVLIGNVALEGVSAQFEPSVRRAVDEASKNPFDTENSAASLGEAVEQVYHDQGYAAVKVTVARAGAPVVAADAIRVPFSVSVDQGRAYKLSAIHLPDGAPVTQAEIDKLLAGPAGAPPEGVRIRSVWVLLSQRYKARGNLDCKITPRPQLDDAAATVSYNVEIDPGPVYRLGFVKFDNVSDQLRAVLTHYWQMMPGDVFDENYVSQFLYTAEQQDAELRRSLAGVKTKFDATADPQTHTVNVVIRLSR